MRLFSKVVDEATKECEVGLGNDAEFYSSIGMSELDVECGYDRKWYLKGWAPTKSEALIKAEALEVAKAERAEAVSRIVVEVDGLKFDGDEESQTRMGRTISAAIALGVNIQTYSQIWVLSDNSVASVTISQLAKALKLAGEAQTALWTVPYQKGV